MSRGKNITDLSEVLVDTIIKTATHDDNCKCKGCELKKDLRIRPIFLPEKSRMVQ